jgi:hypothetical protein
VLQVLWPGFLELLDQAIQPAYFLFLLQEEGVFGYFDHFRTLYLYFELFTDVVDFS